MRVKASTEEGLIENLDYQKGRCGFSGIRPLKLKKNKKRSCVSLQTGKKKKIMCRYGNGPYENWEDVGKRFD